jgi:hypothetical protein
MLGQFDKDTVEYVRKITRWVRSLSFADLVSAIYKHFPGTDAKSIFRVHP